MRPAALRALALTASSIGGITALALRPDPLLLLMICAGIFAGTLAGLLPGIHPNLLASLAGIAMASLIIDGTSLAAFLVSMGITHIITETIPSVFLNAPESDMAEAATPAQRLVARGGGIEAVRLAVGGALSGTVLATLLLPIAMRVMPPAYNLLRPHLRWTLPAFALALLLTERTWRGRLSAAAVFGLAGILGTVVLGADLKEPLLPLLSGLFGLPGLLGGIGATHAIPEQHDTDIIRLTLAERLRTVCAGVVGGCSLMLMPGAGPSQMAALARRAARGVSSHGFLALLGSLAAADFIASIGAMGSLRKARSGVLEEAARWLGTWDTHIVALLCAVTLASAGIAALLAGNIASSFGSRLHLLPQKHISLGALLLIVALTASFDGPKGILALGASCIVGHIAPWRGVARSHAMGCLLIPTILFFWGLRPQGL